MDCGRGNICICGTDTAQPPAGRPAAALVARISCALESVTRQGWQATKEKVGQVGVTARTTPPKGRTALLAPVCWIAEVTEATAHCFLRSDSGLKQNQRNDRPMHDGNSVFALSSCLLSECGNFPAESRNIFYPATKGDGLARCGHRAKRNHRRQGASTALGGRNPGHLLAGG
jgi:hypothetical protein